MNFEYDSMHPNQPSNSRPNRADWTEDQAKTGLAVLNYPGKWSEAQRLCKDPAYYTGGYEGYSYWERVHCMFLELGGCRVSQLLPYQQRAYPDQSRFNALEKLLSFDAPETTADPVLAGPEFGGSDELKSHLHQFWAAELSHDLTKAGL